MAKVIWLVMHEEVEYQEKGPALPNPRTLTRKLRNLVREFQRQGMDVKAIFNQTLEVHG